MAEYFNKSKKSKPIRTLLNEALEILEAVGIPVASKTPRGLEKMAMCMLAVADVKSSDSWAKAKGLTERRVLKTREIISYINEHFDENISSGSYDDIRRKDLKLMVLGGLIINSAENPNAPTNDPTRGYSLEPSFKELISKFKTAKWTLALTEYTQTRESLAESLARTRSIEKVPITLSSGEKLELSAGQHNLLQKLIIEEFLPRFGQGCVLLYVGDTANKSLYIQKEALEELEFFELAHEELPDVIAYDINRNWLYLIEAVHSSGPMSEVRMLELKRMTRKCKAEIVFVTAFLNKAQFKKWMLDIAWESEVWIADDPDHLIHFDGKKYLSPYPLR